MGEQVGVECIKLGAADYLIYRYRLAPSRGFDQDDYRLPARADVLARSSFPSPSPRRSAPGKGHATTLSFARDQARDGPGGDGMLVPLG